MRRLYCSTGTNSIRPRLWTAIRVSPRKIRTLTPRTSVNLNVIGCFRVAAGNSEIVASSALRERRPISRDAFV